MTARPATASIIAKRLCGVFLCLLLAACKVSTTDCPTEQGISYICGVTNAEDIVRIGETEWLLASGMAGEADGNPVNGRLHLINSANRRWQVLYPGETPVHDHDKAMYPDCPGPLDTSRLSLHGLALQNFPAGSSQYRLYMTSHGSREAIETFMLDVSATPSIKWTGCVPLPETVWANSVVILDDGGFMTTKFMDPGEGFAPVLAGRLNGHVLEWHPGEELAVIAGTELSGANGIALSADQRFLFVTAFGGNKLVRFDLSITPATGREVALGLVPDNVRWTAEGKLLTAGGNAEGACFDPAGEPCGPGWSVWEVDPLSLQVRRLTGVKEGSAMATVSTALRVGDEIWTGTPRGDKVAILPAY